MFLNVRKNHTCSVDVKITRFFALDLSVSRIAFRTPGGNYLTVHVYEKVQIELKKNSSHDSYLLQYLSCDVSF